MFALKRKKPGGHVCLRPLIVASAAVVAVALAGCAEPPARGAFEVANGQIRPLVGISAVHDRVSLRTLDAFSSHFVLRSLRGGETLWEAVLAGNTATYRGSGAMDTEGHHQGGRGP